MPGKTPVEKGSSRAVSERAGNSRASWAACRRCHVRRQAELGAHAPGGSCSRLHASAQGSVKVRYMPGTSTSSPPPQSRRTKMTARDDSTVLAPARSPAHRPPVSLQYIIQYADVCRAQGVGGDLVLVVCDAAKRRRRGLGKLLTSPHIAPLPALARFGAGAFAAELVDPQPIFNIPSLIPSLFPSYSAAASLPPPSATSACAKWRSTNVTALRPLATPLLGRRQPPTTPWWARTASRDSGRR